MYYASIFLFACSKYEKARDYLEKALKIDQNNIDALCLRGWTELYLIRNGINTKNENLALQFFHLANNNNEQRHKNNNLDALFGELECMELDENKYEQALNLVNKVIIKFPSIVEPVVRKMKTCFTLKDWDQTSETINRVISTENLNIDGAKMKILTLLCHEGNYSEALDNIRNFYKSLEKSEPKNEFIFYENGRLFSRICNRNKLILGETFTFIQRAMSLNQNDPKYLVEAGYQCLLQGKIKDASKYFKNATKIADTTEALVGMMLCELTENGISGKAAIFPF